MATDLAETQRKVRQLDNDMQEIYEMLSNIATAQKKQGEMLNQVSTTVNQLSVTVNEGTTTQQNQGEMLNQLIAIQMRQNNRLDTLDGKLDQLLSKE